MEEAEIRKLLLSPIFMSGCCSVGEDLFHSVRGLMKAELVGQLVEYLRDKAWDPKRCHTCYKQLSESKLNASRLFHTRY